MSDIDPMLEKHDSHQVVDTDTDVVMQSYPSPTVDAQDNNPFYHTSPRQAHQSQSDLGQHHDGEGQLEELPASRHGGRQDLSSAEELQLAAQLSQGLAHGMPMMDPADDPNLQHVMVQDGLEHHDPELQHASEQLNHDHGQLHHDSNLSHNHNALSHDGLQSHNESIPEQNHDHDQLMAQQQSDQSYHPHEQQQQQQQSGEHSLENQQEYISDQPQHLQPAAPMGNVGAQYSFPDNSVPPRKRSKVSRACDECRRKKVKCDAPTETGEEACSNCRRSNMQCLFSRIPQKRGPSKGYIKELADRINSIEGKLASEGANADLSELLNGSRRDSNDLFPTTESDSRKRPYSNISGADFDTPNASRQSNFGSEPRSIQPYQAPVDRYKPAYSANGLAPTPLAAKPDHDTSLRPEAVMDEIDLQLRHMNEAREVDETLFAGYLTLVHPFYPVLADNRIRLQAQLARCPSMLRDAFIDALHGTVSSFPSFNTDGIFRETLTSATQCVAEWEADMSPRSHIANLVHLQTLILIAISADNYGPSSLKGEHGGAAKSATLGRAVGLAYSMRLHTAQVNAHVDADLDIDSDESVATRAWWTLIMLDRWNAISTASPLLIPNDSVVILPSLRSLLGEGVYHLARLSNILGHFSPVALVAPKVMTFESGAAPLLSSFINLSMELFREVLPTSITPKDHPVLHSAYWHCRLLAYLFQTNSKSNDIMWACKEAAAHLIGNTQSTQSLNPLNHHFFCLTVLTLLELAKVDSQRADANLLLEELLESPIAPSNWDSYIRERIAEHIQPFAVQASIEATASQSLQHLADLATATDMELTMKADKPTELSLLRTSDNYDHAGFDPRVLTRVGYLNALAERRPSTAR